MADHNIYIHAIGTGGDTQYSPTTPWSKKESGGSSPTTSQSGSIGNDITRGIIIGSRYVQNPDSIVNGAVGGLAKAIPWVAAAYAVVKTCVHVIETVVDIQTIKGGDYSTQIAINNAKELLKMPFAPVSSAINIEKTYIRWNNENEKRALNRDLLGDSVINSYTGRGI